MTAPWVRKLERNFQWLAIPNIGVLIVTLQALGFVAVTMVDPQIAGMLALFPHRVAEGEYWRLITYLAMPLSQSPIWVIFVLWFLYFVMSSIEGVWGSLKTTVYVMTSIVAMIAYSFSTGYPITDVRHFESTLFLAAAVLFPEMQVSLFMIFPVKMKWLAALSGVFIGWEFLTSAWIERGLILTVFSNFLLFFAPATLERIRLWRRRKSFRGQLRGN